MVKNENISFKDYIPFTCCVLISIFLMLFIGSIFNIVNGIYLIIIELVSLICMVCLYAIYIQYIKGETYDE